MLDLGRSARIHRSEFYAKISLGKRVAYYTLVCGVSFSWRSVASRTHRHSFSERRGTRRRASRSPSYSGWGFPNLDRWTAMRAASKAPQGKAVPSQSAVHRSHLDRFPAEQGERAMPMLFWLPMIFASALWEINGFPLPPNARVN